MEVGGEMDRCLTTLISWTEDCDSRHRAKRHNGMRKRRDKANIP